MTSNTNVPTKFYVATDHNTILTLNVVSHTIKNGLIKVETEVAPGSTESDCYFHESYFKKIYLALDGTIRDKSVFAEFEPAKQFAIKCLKESIDIQERELTILQTRLSSLCNKTL